MVGGVGGWWLLVRTGVYDTHVCPCVPTRVHAILKTDRRQCASPFGWTVQPETPYACAFESRFQASPRCKNLTQPQVEEKDCEARPHLTLHSFRGRGAQSFPSPRRWMTRIRDDMRRITWTCLAGKPDPITHVTTCIQEMTRSNRLICIIPQKLIPGNDQGGNRMVKPQCSVGASKCHQEVPKLNWWWWRWWFRRGMNTRVFVQTGCTLAYQLQTKQCQCTGPLRLD